MKKSLLLVALIGFILLSTSCQKPEAGVLLKYFSAMKMNDRDTMSSMALSPRKFAFKSHKVVTVSEPVIADAILPDLVAVLDKLKEDQRSQLDLVQEKKDEVDELYFQLEETRRASTKRKLQAQIDTLEVEVEEETNKFKAIVSGIADAKKAIDVEKELVKKSAGMDENPELLSGKSHTSVVNVNVELEDGGSEVYLFTLVKYEYIHPQTNRAIPNRYIITNIQTKAEAEAEKMKIEEAKALETTEDVTEEKVADQKTGDK